MDLPPPYILISNSTEKQTPKKRRFYLHDSSFSFVDLSNLLQSPLADPNSFISMQLSVKNLQNNRLAHPLWDLASPPTPPRKILDQPLITLDYLDLVSYLLV